MSYFIFLTVFACPPENEAEELTENNPKNSNPNQYKTGSETKNSQKSLRGIHFKKGSRTSVLVLGGGYSASGNQVF